MTSQVRVSTISGSRGYQGAQAIDGIHADSKNYAYTIWTNAVKGTLTLDMEALGYDPDARFSVYDEVSGAEFHRRYHSHSAR